MLKQRRQIIVATICLCLALTPVSALATQDPPQSPPAKLDFKFEKVDLDLLIGALALTASGCGQSAPTNTSSSSSPKPGGSPATSAPKAKEKKAPATNPVPADWIRMYDDAKGYEFMVPKGTEHKSQNVEGVDVYLANVPAPYDIGIIVVAFKDNYIMLVGVDADKFDANEKTIDEIWGSFGMYSGGSSGNS